MGYLGKISAIVTANTSDFSRNLNTAASGVRKFAGSVQSNLTKAANDAERSFRGIYTPLQTLERSLKAAATMKLSFKGFDGAIRDLGTLKDRLTAVKGTQIDLILKASGLRTISEFREAIKDISNESFNFAIKFGGIDKLKLIREELRGVSETSISAVLEAGGLARLKELKETVSGLQGNQLALALKVGGTEKLTKVEQQAAGLSRKDMSLLVKVGGADALDKIVEELSGVNSRSLDALVNVKGVAELDAIISRFQRLSPEAIQAVIQVIGTQDLDAAMNKMRQMYSAAQQVFQPLDEAAAKFGTMSAAVQDAFAPALISAQRAAENLKADIDSGATIGVQRFNSLAAAADRVRESVDRISEASSLISGFNPGTSLQFREPEAVSVIGRLNRLQSQALSSLTPSELRAGGFAQRSSQIAEDMRELERLVAVKGKIEADGPGATVLSQQRYNEQLETANRLIEQQLSLLGRRAMFWEQAVSDQMAARGDLPFVAASDLEAAAERLAPGFVPAQELTASAEAMNVGRSTTLPPGYLENRERERLFGRDIEDPRRRMDALVSGTNSLKGQVAQLSAPLRGQMVADIRAAEQEFIRLRASIDPSADAIAAAEARLRQLEGTARRLSAIDAFGRAFGDIDEFLGESRVRQAQGEMEAARSVLAGVQETPRNRDRLRAARQAYRDLFSARNDELRLPEDATQADRDAAARRSRAAQEQFINTSAAATGRSRSRVRRIVQRGGDVGRMGGDTASLAMNQIAFAIDDFMSSTGGVEFKLRAISNNITQMAFLLGGTAGLFIGLGAVFGGQLAIGLMKWANNGKSAEDQTKALNDALSRQKSLVDAVAESFRSLADEIAGGLVSDSGKFQQEIGKLQRTQTDRRRDALAGADPDVLLARAEQNRIQRELEDEATPGRRAVLMRQLDSARAAEQAAIRRAASEPPATGAEVRGRIEESARQTDRVRNAAGSMPFAQSIFDLFFGRSDTNAIRRFGQQVDTGTGVDAVQSQIEGLNKTNAELSKTASRRVFGFETRESLDAEKQLAKNASMIARKQDELAGAIDAAMVALINSIRGPSQEIRDAQADVADAIKQGVPSAKQLQIRLDTVGNQLNDALREFQDAQSEANPVARLNREIVARQRIDDALNSRDDLVSQADAMRRTLAVDPQAQAAAIEARARENLSSAGLSDGRIARRMREIGDDRVTLSRQREAFADPMSQRLFAESEAAMNRELAALEAATIAIKIFADTLNKASEETKANLNAAQQAADEARRADLGFSTPQTQRDRQRADNDLQRQRELDRRAQEEIAVERDRLEQLQRPQQDRLRQINKELLGGEGGIDREALIREREALTAQMEDDARASQDRINRIRDESTQEEERRRAAGRGREMVARTDPASFAEETARGLADIREEFDRRADANNGLRPAGDAEAQRVAERDFLTRRRAEELTATPAGRGQALMMTERERSSRELEGVVSDITARAEDLAGRGIDPAAELRQGIRNQMERVAPMLTEFQGERETASLQGPSRAALTVSDITTSQGASELSRLLRRDDPARDANLSELQKQTQKFDDLIQAIRDANPTVVF